MELRPRLLFVSGLLVNLLIGCGGNTDYQCASAARCPGNDSGGSSGATSASGGEHASGGNTILGGSPGNGGASGLGGAPGKGGAVGLGGMSGARGGSTGLGGAFASGGSVVCCEAYPTCEPGDSDIGPNASCPQGTTCYMRSLCCTTIYCAHPNPTCLALPACDPGDMEITGECPPDGSCYQRTVCGSTINCLDTACDPSTEPNKKYVATAPSACALIDFVCPANTKYFQNGCGCGCEQDPVCPPVIDCQPGGNQDPLCSQASKCPYSMRLD
ncbi:MAG TPA: hypothetical protein VFQ35_27325 [Polyangiaceae bacterium]|nr:hypothetical protein [Polyangiaceae bacterium]